MLVGTFRTQEIINAIFQGYSDTFSSVSFTEVVLLALSILIYSLINRQLSKLDYSFAVNLCTESQYAW